MQQNNKKEIEIPSGNASGTATQNAPQSNVNLNILFLSDLPNNIAEDDLRSFFKDYSERIKLISINPSKFNSITKKLKPPSATLVFSDHKTAEMAKRSLNMKKLKGKTIRIMWHTTDKNLIENPNTNIYIKNIPDLVTPRQVFEHFSKYGEIISCKIPENEEGDHFGFGYISYMDADSAKNAIDSENGNKVWNSILDVMQFVQVKERLGTLISNNSCTLYLRDFPENFSEENLTQLCQQFREIQSCKIINDKAKPSFQIYAVLIFSSAQAAEGAKIALNNMQIEDKFLKAENYKTKEEKYASSNYESFIAMNNAGNPTNVPDYNSYLNMNASNSINHNFIPKPASAAGLNNNNLHIRNIPFDANESDLIGCFSKFGEIKSAKIERINLVTKVGEEYKEIPKSQGFGYVCFSKHEEAQKAKEGMDGKFLPKFEMWKRPLLIDFFLPKNMRKNAHSTNKPQNYYYDNVFQNNPNVFPVPVTEPRAGEALNDFGIPNSFNQQPQPNFFNKPQQQMNMSQQNISYQPYYNNNIPNADNFNMQAMYQNVPNMPPVPHQNINRNFKTNMQRPGPVSSNPQFYQKQAIPNNMQNVNVFPNTNQNMIYSKHNY